MNKMTDFVDFAIFGIMTGLFSAIGNILAQVYIKPHLERHKEDVSDILSKVGEIYGLKAKKSKKFEEDDNE